MGVTTTAIIWACVAKLKKDSGSGQAGASGEVKEIQAPVGGVVKAVYVSDGNEYSKALGCLAWIQQQVLQLASCRKFVLP